MVLSLLPEPPKETTNEIKTCFFAISHEERIRLVDAINLGASESVVVSQIGQGNEGGILIHPSPVPLEVKELRSNFLPE